jgi:hypothetical protein
MTKNYPSLTPKHKPSANELDKLTREFGEAIESDRKFDSHIRALMHNYKGKRDLRRDAIEGFFDPHSSSHSVVVVPLTLGDFRDFLSLELDRFLDERPGYLLDTADMMGWIKLRGAFRTFAMDHMNYQQESLFEFNRELLLETFEARVPRPEAGIPGTAESPVIVLSDSEEEEEEEEPIPEPPPPPLSPKPRSPEDDELALLEQYPPDEYIRVPGQSLERVWPIAAAAAFVQKELILEFFKDADIRVPDQVKRLRGLPTTPAEEKRFKSDEEITRVGRERKSENERTELVKTFVKWLQRRKGIEKARSRQLVWYHMLRPEFLREQLELGLDRILERTARIPGPTVW